jgi:hypothetical protein
LDKLNDIVPELYQMAYNKHNQETTDLYNQYNLLMNHRSVEKAEADKVKADKADDLSNIENELLTWMGNAENNKDKVDITSQLTILANKYGLSADDVVDLYNKYNGKTAGEIAGGVKDRTWTITDYGKGNLMGIDKNAEATDQYNNTYSLKDIRRMLKEEYGMTDHQANKWIKENIGEA